MSFNPFGGNNGGCPPGTFPIQITPDMPGWNPNCPLHGTQAMGQDGQGGQGQGFPQQPQQGGRGYGGNPYGMGGGYNPYGGYGGY